METNARRQHIQGRCIQCYHLHTKRKCSSTAASVVENGENIPHHLGHEIVFEYLMLNSPASILNRAGATCIAPPSLAIYRYPSFFTMDYGPFFTRRERMMLEWTAPEM